MKKLSYCILVWIIISFVNPLRAQLSSSNRLHDKYILSEVVVLSRHNIRSPLTGSGSVIERITPYKWYSWSSRPSNLSQKGGIMETIMGQYFSKWLVNEGLFQEDAVPSTDEIRVYANSMQRTLATAHYFMSGFMPVANVSVEHHCNIGVMDSIFTPQITYLDDEFCNTAFREIAEMTGEQIEMHKASTGVYYCVLENTHKKLANNYALLYRVLDMQNSPACKYGDSCGFAEVDTIWLKLYREPATTGSLNMARMASDALILQYYEERDSTKAAFAHDLTPKEWLQLSGIKQWYDSILFTVPSIARQIATPLLNEIAKELDTPGRKFSFLCGHDSNIGSVLTALGVTDYNLPNTIETKTPVGAKLVFEKWMNPQGEYYISVNMIFHSTNQIRQGRYEPCENEPIIFPIQFNSISANADGLYSFIDFMKILTKK